MDLCASMLNTVFFFLPLLLNKNTYKYLYNSTEDVEKYAYASVQELLLYPAVLLALFGSSVCCMCTLNK